MLEAMSIAVHCDQMYLRTALRVVCLDVCVGSLRNRRGLLQGNV